LLQNTPWPGNVRELKQVVEASAAFARGIIDERAVSAALTHRAPADAPPRAREDLAARRELVLALERASWNTTRAASMLGLHRATIYRRMKRHGIDLPGN
jgi:transcriptional regulator of acetoin/glycerol metabolism